MTFSVFKSKALGIVASAVVICVAGWSATGTYAQQATVTTLTAAEASAPLAASRVQSGARWAQLTARQQQALAPLDGQWDTLGDAHRRKWLALSNNYASMSVEDQTRLHARMMEWAGLTAQQRSQARLVFAETKKLAADDRKMQWEAYQALSEDEKRKLASVATPQTLGAATAVRPVSPSRLAVVPISKSNPLNPPRVPVGSLPASAPAATTLP